MPSFHIMQHFTYVADQKTPGSDAYLPAYKIGLV